MSGTRRPGRKALLGSVVLHLAAVGVIWASGLAAAPETPEFEVYRVDIVSPPPAAAGEPTPAAEEPEEQPEPEPEPEPEPPPPEPEPEQQPVPDPDPEPESEPEREQPPPDPEPEEEPERAEEARGANPDRESDESGEGLDVQISGADFPFPGYLSNIIRQVHRYFRWDGADGLVTEIYFVIDRDGSVADIRVLEGSGNTRFDFAAMAAIEQAGQRGAFGSLPEDFEADRLPVSFYFRPSR